MRSQLLKVSALVLGSALVAPLTYGQEEAEAEAPRPRLHKRSRRKILTSSWSW